MSGSHRVGAGEEGPCFQLDSFPDLLQDFRRIHETHEDMIFKVKAYREAISSYEGELLTCRGDSLEASLQSASVRTKLALAQLALARQITSLPASMSESRAIFDEDPEIIAKRACRTAERCENILAPCLGLVKEIQGHCLTMTHEENAAGDAFRESLRYHNNQLLSQFLGKSNATEAEGEEEEEHQEDGVLSSRRKRNKGSSTRATPDRDDDMDCLICLKLLYEPVTTPCGHTFCRPCFQRTLDANSRCPLCRRVFYSGFDLPVNITLKNILERGFPDEYNSRREEEQASCVEGAGMVEQLPLFVLSPMMPGEIMHLNVFEPRYRLMIRRVMEGNKKFGIISMRGNNMLAPVGCEVDIVDIEAIPDGRYAIEVKGTKRFSITTVDQVDGYRVAIQPEYFSDDNIGLEECDDIRKLVDEVDELVRRWIDKLSEMTESRQTASLLLQTAGAHPGKEDLEKFSFWAATSILSFVQGRERKQRMIETRSTQERLENAKELLLAAEELSNRGPGGPCSLM